MIRVDYIAQPSSRTTLDAIERIAQIANIETMDVAAAYITSGGVNDLVKRTSVSMGGAWNGVKKRWITSFDYCRTDPEALEVLLSIPSSSVRIHDADFCLEHAGWPKVPFHPKAFLFRSDLRDYVLTGSGNVSRSGLSRGIEAGLAIDVKRTGPNEPTSSAAVNEMRTWFSTNWKNATPLNPALLARYGKLCESVPNLKSPVPTEDDLASSDIGSGALSGKDLQKLRVCRHFWTEAGNITKNRGPHLPGNQLMMKRLTRVFFGFNQTAVPENTLLGAVDMYFDTGAPGQYSLTYSDNKMDKLNLPTPGIDGPLSYDNQCLLFRRMAPKVFKLTLGTKADRATWLKRSIAIEGAFKMTSGREWGVY
jgi:HKD family nuclease